LAAAIRVLNGEPRPTFGPGLSERAIETPWVASHFKGGERVLDVGFTMSSLDYLGLLLELRRAHGVTIEAVDIVTPDRVRRRYPQEWVEEVMAVPITIGDLRTQALPTGRYDVATIISTIEHIGFDEATHADPVTAFARSTTPEGVRLHRDANVNRDVLARLGSALRPGGLLLVSVPMGRGGPTLLKDSLDLYCAQWEYEAASWREIVEAPEFDVVEQEFFRLEADGTWKAVKGPADLGEQSSSLKPFAAGVALAALRRRTI
jgi:SAM-dependent methyltransferase